MATNTKRRRAYTEEERAAVRERDARVSAEAERVLSDPAEVAKLVDRLLHSQLGPKLLSYSLRNQALVITQAMDRGIPLSDVAGRKTWNQRGRMIRKGQQGIRIVATKGDLEETSADTDPGTVTDGGEQERKDRRPLFRMTNVWDRSQTADAFEAEEPDDEQPVADAARVLLDNLTRQLDRRDYQVVEDTPDSDTPRASNIDHDAQTITVMTDWKPRDRLLALALGLAQTLTLAAEKRDAKKAG